MQFFLTHHHAKSNVFEISGGEAFHIAKVLRKKPGDVLRLFDGKGKVLWGKIERIASERVTGRIVVEGPDIEPLPFDIHVYQALPKGAKWDWVLEKGCELGVRRFVPLMTSRTVVQIARSEVSKKMARWRSVLQAAAKQSGSTRLPEIEEPKTFQEAIGLISRVESRESKVALFAWESETVSPVWKVLDRFDNLPETVSVFIGPEGGWSLAEAEEAKKAGCLWIGLGPHVLRTETAPIVAVSMITAILMRSVERAAFGEPRPGRGA